VEDLLLTTHRSLNLVLIVALTLTACSSANTSATTATPVSALNPATPTPLPATVAATPGTKLQWPAPPPMTIDPSKIYLATFKTAKGDIKAQLFPDKAPITVNSFIFLAKAGYYDNTTFHRVIHGFMAQGGDPTATGTGGPGYQFKNEIHPDLTFAEPGMLAMANAGPDTNGSQFFITYTATQSLNGGYTIFGKVVAGMEVALAISERDPKSATTPGDALYTVTIEELAQSLLPPPTPTPMPRPPELVDGRPLAKLAVAERANLFNAPPAMMIDPAKIYSATIVTSKGTITAELYPADAPQSVNNFYVLANLGYWDNFPIVYVQPDTSATATAPAWVITGSPDGTAISDVGYGIPSEVKRTHTVGSLGYYFRKDKPGFSSGSQFYILLNADSRFNFDANLTAFGQVTTGMDIVQSLTMSDTITMITVAVK
jgi:cyclophilin family peptidyl-prolyl cis-trans isomerase